MEARIKTYRVHDFEMFVDPPDTLGLKKHGSWHSALRKVAMKYIKEGDIALDIGAMIGYFTIIFSKLVGEDGRIFAFEPHPRNFDILKKNIEINHCKNVIPVQKALSDKNGKARLYCYDKNRGKNTIFHFDDEYSEFFAVKTVRLDDYFKENNQRIDFIKIDAEGADMAVVQGMGDLLKNNINTKVVTEYWPLGLGRFGYKPENYLELLREYGFKLYEIVRTQDLIPTTISQLLKRYPTGKSGHTDLFCIRENGNQRKEIESGKFE